MSPVKLHPPYNGVTMHSAPALRNRPALATEVAVVIGVWAEIEHMIGLILADTLGSDAALGLAIFFSLRSDKPQQEVIRVAAERKLSKETAARVTKFVRGLRDHSKPRNKLAHGMWGFTDRHPDELLWCDRENTADIWALANAPILGKTDLPIYRYTLPYLEGLAADALNLLSECQKLLREVQDDAQQRLTEAP